MVSFCDIFSMYMNDKYICINLIYLLMALCLVFDIGYIICKAKNKNIIGLFAKTFAALCFITIGYFGYKANDTLFTRFILLGLILDGIGDLFLAFRNIFAKKLTFFIGTLAFLAGHIVFIRALTLLNNVYFIECIIISILFGSIVFYLLSKACRLNKIYTVVGISYIMIISMMVFLSVGVYLTTSTINHLTFMIGAILFMSSDIILSLYNFSRKDKWMHPTYSLLYFIAQILISFSLHI